MARSSDEVSDKTTMPEIVAENMLKIESCDS
jgi:hypothetical protein